MTPAARAATGEAASVPAESLAGQFGEIRAVFGRVPARRLLILGGSGTGKSVLAIRLVRDLDNRPLSRRSGPGFVHAEFLGSRPSTPY